MRSIVGMAAEVGPATVSALLKPSARYGSITILPTIRLSRIASNAARQSASG
jgi:hypothetical protein